MEPKGLIRNLLSRLSWEIYILLALPFLITFGWAQGYWPFSVIGYLDPWVYFGYYQELQSHFQVFGPTYYSTRLAHILPGYFLYSWFDPLWANYILHFSWFYIAVFSLYYLLTVLLDRNSAFWSSLLMGLNPWFLFSIGDDYPDGTCIAYFLLSAALLALAARSRRWKLWMVVAGVVFACSVNTHTFGLFYLPVLFLIFLYLNNENKQHPLVAGSGLFIAGSLLGGGIFWIIYYQLSGGSNIYVILYKIINTLRPDHKSLPLERFPFTLYLHLATALFVLSTLILLVKNKKYKNYFSYWTHPDHRAIMFCLGLLVFYGWEFIFLEISPFMNMLGLHYYVSYLIPVAYIGLGGILARSTLSTGRYSKQAAAFFLILITAGPFHRAHLYLIELPSNKWMWLVLTLWICFLVLLGLGPRLAKSKFKGAVVICLLLFGCYYSINPKEPSLFLSKEMRSRPNLKNGFISINKGMEALKEVDPDPVFWFSKKDPNVILFHSLTSTHLWGYKIISMDFPKVLKKYLYIGKTVAILSSDPRDEDRGISAIKEKGVEPIPITQKRIASEYGEFYITFIRLGKPILPEKQYENPEKVFEADSNFLLTRFAQHIYGKRGEHGNIRVDGDRLTFHPTTQKDNLSSPVFTTEPKNPDEDYWMRMRLTYPSDSVPSSECIVIVQDTEYHFLHQAPCYNTSQEHPNNQEEQFFKIPGTKTQFRLVIMSRGKVEPTLIPNHITIDKIEKKTKSDNPEEQEKSS